MKYKQMKWLILIIPALSIAMWEYVRHDFLLPYISMELGNWLAPLFVLLVSLLFLTQLFTLIEKDQEELNRAKEMQAVLEEREKIAQELHDGIAQSLFFLNAQLVQIESKQQFGETQLLKLKESVHRTNDYVRQAIANLRHPADIHSIPWLQSVESLINELRQETAIQFETNWAIPETALTPKEKVELLAIMREALLNIHKHAAASKVRIEASTTRVGWTCRIVDNGRGFTPDDMNKGNRFGLRMMMDRAKTMSWQFSIDRVGDDTIVEIRKGGN